MQDKLNIITYHYVRDRSKDFPFLNILKIKHFKQQIKYLYKNKKVLSPEEIHYRLNKKIKFKSSEYWLTFDDGYKEHSEIVLNILQHYKLNASFYPMNLIKRKNVMKVNKIQFILSKFKIRDKLLLEIKKNYYEFFKSNKPPLFEKYIKQKNIFNVRDDHVTRNIKSLLTSELPIKISDKIVDKLFKKYVSKNENEFAKRLYLNLNELKKIKKFGNEIGAHGLTHKKLEFLSFEKQYKEISNSKNFLNQKKLLNENYWSFCYPHGSYNKSSIKILKELNCNCALTIQKASFDRKYPFEFPRIDTNNLVYK